MNNAHLRKSLLGYTKWLLEQAKAAEDLPSTSEDDRRNLAEDREVLAGSVEGLVEIIRKHDALVAWVMTVFDDLRPEDKAALAAIFEKPVVLDGLADLSGVMLSIKRLEKNAREARWRGGRSKAQLLADIWKLAEPRLDAKPDLKAPQLAAEILGPLNEGRRLRGVKNLTEGTITRKLNELMVDRGLRTRHRASKVCTTS